MGVTFEKDFKGQIIRPKDLETLFEINPNHKAYTKKIHPDWPYRYLMIDDVLVNPYDVRDFLINSSYICGTNDLVPDKTGAPGMQQPVANAWMKPYVQFLRQVLFDEKITHRDITWYDFSLYCNVFWKNMKAIDSNYRPHVDPGDFAFNLFLSDDLDESDGTNMFIINMPDGQRQMDARHLEKKCRIHPRIITQRMDQGRIGEGLIDDWKLFDGDDVYDLAGRAPARFNCITGYQGSLFHTAAYDPRKYSDDHVRYSLVAMLSVTDKTPVNTPFITQKPNDE